MIPLSQTKTFKIEVSGLDTEKRQTTRSMSFQYEPGENSDSIQSILTEYALNTWLEAAPKFAYNGIKRTRCFCIYFNSVKMYATGASDIDSFTNKLKDVLL